MQYNKNEQVLILFKYMEKSQYFVFKYFYLGRKESEKWIVPSVISSSENELQAYQQNTDRGRPSEAEGKMTNHYFPLFP